MTVRLKEKMADLRRRYLSTGITMIVLAAITGTCAGVGAWFLKFSIRHISVWCFNLLKTEGYSIYIVLAPLCAIVIAGIYQRYIARADLEHGTQRISEALAQHRYRMPVSAVYQPVIGSIITLGLGGSAGAEGPIAAAGAAMGSNVARLFGVGPRMIATMIGCGAGAGIAGIFKSPVGGVLFALEVLRMPMRTLPVLALFVASVCGSMTCYALTGFSFDVTFLPDSLFTPRKFAWVVALGAFCGVYSVYYNRMTALLHRLFGKMRNPWLRNVSGGITVGLCLLLFPTMYGEGYDTVTALINNRYEEFLTGSPFAAYNTGIVSLIIFGCAVLALKVFATIATNSAGGVAGDFAPTMFAGAFAGMVFALGANYFFNAQLPPGLYALYGMAAAFAGIIHAPLMSIFLVAEMVGNGYGYILPLMIASVVSYLTMKILTPKSKYANADHDDIDALLHTPELKKGA